MNLEQRLELATRGTVEIIQRSELEKLLEDERNPRAYWGFECSGTQVHSARNDAHRPRSRLRLQDA
jgi:tyrosyl-tRNA synthetase